MSKKPEIKEYLGDHFPVITYIENIENGVVTVNVTSPIQAILTGHLGKNKGGSFRLLRNFDRAHGNV